MFQVPFLQTTNIHAYIATGHAAYTNIEVCYWYMLQCLLDDLASLSRQERALSGCPNALHSSTHNGHRYQRAYIVVQVVQGSTSLAYLGHMTHIVVTCAE